MELTSPLYFLVLLILFAIHWAAPRSWRSIALLAGSYGLYAIWDLRYLYVLLGSTAFDFTLALLIEREAKKSRKKLLLILSLASNIGILFFFKYTNFALGFFQMRIELFVPLGVSFYTFHSISYIVDVYRGKTPASRSLVNYALYVSFFPKLISGPIERTEKFLPQLVSNRTLNFNTILESLELLLYGLFLKLCIGDRLSFVTTGIFENSETLGRLEHWVGFYAYSLQIYADFFGYTLIARGSALLFGLRLSENFFNPYLSSSPREFWRRWHVSLSSWFRDYLYFPLGGERKRMWMNLMITMALAGLWHGADLKFLFWGLFHGALVCTQKLVFGKWEPRGGWKRYLGIAITFHAVSFGWLFFKAKDFSHAVSFASRMIHSNAGIWPDPKLEWLIFLLVVWGIFIGLRKARGQARFGGFSEVLFLKLPWQGFLMGCMLVIVAILGATNAKPFVYFYF